MSDRRRLVAFASAALALVAITGLLAWRDPHLADQQGARSHAPGTATATAIRTGPDPASGPSAVPSSSAATPSAPEPSQAADAPEQEADDAPAVALNQARPAAAAARAFLDGYIAYSYGRAQARAIRSASRALWSELEAEPPRVLARIADSRPRVISVRAQAATGGLAVDVRAVVEDGRRRYGLRLAVRGDGTRWVVAAVGG